MHPARIAVKLGQSDPGAPDKIRKQIGAAEKRYSDIAENVRKMGDEQRPKNATAHAPGPAPANLKAKSATATTTTPEATRTRRKK
jgi:hypothetical protein